MTLKDQLDALLDATAFDSTGTKIGAVRQVYVDDATGKITFATVSTGIFSSDAIVPLHGARLLDGELHVDHTRSAVRDSPRPDHTEDGLTPDQEIELLEHYGVEVPARGTAAPGAKEPREEKTTTKTPSSADKPAAADKTDKPAAAGEADTADEPAEAAKPEKAAKADSAGKPAEAGNRAEAAGAEKPTGKPAGPGKPVKAAEPSEADGSAMDGDTPATPADRS